MITLTLLITMYREDNDYSIIYACMQSCYEIVQHRYVDYKSAHVMLWKFAH